MRPQTCLEGIELCNEFTAKGGDWRLVISGRIKSEALTSDDYFMWKGKKRFIKPGENGADPIYKLISCAVFDYRFVMRRFGEWIDAAVYFPDGKIVSLGVSDGNTWETKKGSKIEIKADGMAFISVYHGPAFSGLRYEEGLQLLIN